MMKMFLCFTFGLLIINSLLPVSIFFYGMVLSLCVLAEIGFSLSDFISLLAFMVYISGITAVIGYFVTFFPKKLEGGFFQGCRYSWMYMIFITCASYLQGATNYFGLSLSMMWSGSVSAMSFFGLIVQLLAPLLLIVMVAVVFMSKPEEMTLRRWRVVEY
uniref:NADH dehydrogenase subunit 6 n=1 Tax=Crassostrea ariakensis TaxID=3244846 RepID=D7SGQ9_CRAAR|nr:NADH dehydrogenase subunit 6 [Crassostrea ariakensis]ACD35466.1 NADH dehydrogenase subunit 6 [Crassostrea ariakensis]AIM52314.1 NADH dehydrogenase subunit 6 [Crassostrea ariakensis]AIM52327.1 NADH dehydrogenase subunit 6 [Crassostrea ariakensis]AIM52340.1 NADH dehydrogenase subunit 6 [Crassostrea ariakensis]AIM52353.1 NADH dehydrogenase subunit 6 [Crassostrea ariakensis]